MINEKELIVAKVGENAKLPTREADSIGYDCYAYGNHVVNIGETRKIPLGFAMVLPVGYGMFLWDRSSMGAKGIHRFAGVIDYSYRDQVQVILFNSTDRMLEIKHGDRIVQFIVSKIEEWPIHEIGMDELLGEKYKSIRGTKGFGSTETSK